MKIPTKIWTKRWKKSTLFPMEFGRKSCQNDMKRPISGKRARRQVWVCVSFGRPPFTQPPHTNIRVRVGVRVRVVE